MSAGNTAASSHIFFIIFIIQKPALLKYFNCKMEKKKSLLLCPKILGQFIPEVWHKKRKTIFVCICLSKKKQTSVFRLYQKHRAGITKTSPYPTLPSVWENLWPWKNVNGHTFHCSCACVFVSSSTQCHGSFIQYHYDDKLRTLSTLRGCSPEMLQYHF